MAKRGLNPNNVPSHLFNQLVKFQSLIMRLHYCDDEDFAEEEFSDKNLLKGAPAPFMKVLHFCLNEWSSYIANFVLKLGYSFEEKTDWNFMETVFSFIRNVMKTTPVLSLEQFFAQGYTLPKLKMVNTTVQYLIDQHIELRRKANPPKRLPRRVLAERSEKWVQKRKAVLTKNLRKSESEAVCKGSLPKQKAGVNSVDMTPSHVMGTCTPTKTRTTCNSDKANVTRSLPLLSSPMFSGQSRDHPTPQVSACPELTPLPPALVKRVRGWVNAETENPDPINLESYTIPQKQTSAVEKPTLSKPQTIEKTDSAHCNEKALTDASSPQLDGFPLEHEAFREKAIGEINRLTKLLSELQDAHEMTTLKSETRISELEKRYRELEREMALCTSRIEIIADKQPKFSQKDNLWRRSDSDNTIDNQSNISLDFPLTERPNFSKTQLLAPSRPSPAAYARPVARQAECSVATKPAFLQTASGELFAKKDNKFSKSNHASLRVEVSKNYERLMNLMNDRSQEEVSMN